MPATRKALELLTNSAARERDGVSMAGGPRLPQIDTTPLHERAYLQLKGALMAGRFRPGEAVTLLGVADALGTSVMPVREAVRRLVSERAFEMPTSRSIRVPFLSREHFEDLCRTRLLVEGEAASLAAGRCTPQVLDRLREINLEINRQMAAGDGRAMLAANQTFHFSVYAQSGSALLLAMAESLWLQGGPYLNLMIARHHSSNTLDLDNGEHDQLISALERGDPLAAKEAIRSDIINAAARYRATMADEEAAASNDSDRRRIGL